MLGHPRTLYAVHRGLNSNPYVAPTRDEQWQYYNTPSVLFLVASDDVTEGSSYSGVKIVFNVRPRCGSPRPEAGSAP